MLHLQSFPSNLRYGSPFLKIVVIKWNSEDFLNIFSVITLKYQSIYNVALNSYLLPNGLAIWLALGTIEFPRTINIRIYQLITVKV